MLPPFVPPSARVSSERLPLITEFVVDRVEHSFGRSFKVSGGSEAGTVATLPSIDEFVREEPPTSHADQEFVQRTSRSPWGAYEGRHEVSGQREGVPASKPLEPNLVPTERRTPPSGSEDAIVNEIAEPADAWAASASGAITKQSAAESSTAAREAASESPPALAQTASEVWVTEERDAFDWHAAANLAVPPAEEQRAAEEWSSTEWERSSGSVQDHVATILAQVSRRVRAGELEVQGSKQMGPEAALVAVLAALLAELGTK
ncbi:MAG TPA: hypothetical protein VII66_07135 [Gemmatimonadaceae bacterium]